MGKVTAVQGVNWPLVLLENPQSGQYEQRPLMWAFWSSEEGALHKRRRKIVCEWTLCERQSLRCHHSENESWGRSHQETSRAAQAFSSTSALTEPFSFSGTKARGAPMSLLLSGLLQSEVPQPTRETQPPLSESPGNICRKTPPSRGTLPRGSESAAPTH